MRGKSHQQKVVFVHATNEDDGRAPTPTTPPDDVVTLLLRYYYYDYYYDIIGNSEPAIKVVKRLR